ncbi:MAG: type I pullulanase [Erysipelotrichaceae bacterium]
MNQSVEAYLDGYGIVHAYVSHQFYNGQTDRFYLKDQDGKRYECFIQNMENQKGFSKYRLEVPTTFDFSKAYTITEAHGYCCPLQIRHIVKTDLFNEAFFYDQNDLGANYTQERTVFKVFAPTAIKVFVEITINQIVYVYEMSRQEKGVYEACVEDDLDQASYVYLVHVNGEIKRALDPYAISGLANSKASAIVNLLSYHGNSCTLPPLEKMTDAIIYEASVRDFTHHESSSTKTNSLFMSLCEEGTSYRGLPTGLDYICSLGITHLQLMPVFDFFTVDEEEPNLMYNWGYDPAQYGVSEGSYCSDPNDPSKRVFELKKMIEVMHEHGIRVNLDVVFNHYYDVKLSFFDALVPHYYFRTNDSGYLSNGTYCGNDIESRAPMCCKWMVDTCVRLIDLFDIDGLRFDLMGIVDIQTMNKIVKACVERKPGFMVYGEGWNMPTALSQGEKTIQANSANVPSIGFFNDVFRDVLKGKSSKDEVHDKGYLTGEDTRVLQAQHCLMAHSHEDYKIYQNPGQSINYVECHDNYTVWDKMKICCQSEDNPTRAARQKMMLAMTMVAQGVPFFHSGQEFCRSKSLVENSYHSPDAINQIDWNRLTRYKECYDYFKELCKLRKQYDCLRYDDAESLKSIHFEVLHGVLFYHVGSLMIAFNASREDKVLENIEGKKIVFDRLGYTNQNYNQIPALSMLVFEKEGYEKNTM